MRHMRYLIIIVLVSLTGCSTLSGVKTGKNMTTTYFDKAGNKVRVAEQYDQPLFDTQYEYQRTVREVATQASLSDQARAKAISQITKKTIDNTKSGTEKALIGVIGALSLERMKSSIPTSLASIDGRPMTLSEAGLKYISALTSIAWTVPVTIAVRENGKTARSATRSVGTKINIAGDSNNVHTSDVKNISEVHANSTGDNSPPSVNNHQETGKCKDGKCGKKDTLESCEDNPPGGFSNGTAWWNTTGCSCKSHYEGKC